MKLHKADKRQICNISLQQRRISKFNSQKKDQTLTKYCRTYGHAANQKDDDEREKKHR